MNGWMGRDAATVADLFAGTGGMGLASLLTSELRDQAQIIFTAELEPSYVSMIRRNYSYFARRIGDADRHGLSKRIRVVADLIRTTGWHLQTLMAQQRAISTNGAATNGASKGNAALLTLDAAMVLVDEALATTDSRRACTREEAQLAFEYLTNPIVRQAAWTEDTHTSIVILRT